jgi:hypothetical protein
MSQLADQPAAVVSGGPALWLSNVRRSPRVVGAVAAAVSRPATLGCTPLTSPPRSQPFTGPRDSSSPHRPRRTVPAM